MNELNMNTADKLHYGATVLKDNPDFMRWLLK